MRNLHDIEGRRMEPEKKDDLTAAGAVALLVALGMMCATVLAIVWMIWG